jgi:dTDP-4-dehydrorhamnose reductase
MSKRILITGSNGLLGQKLVEVLRKRQDVELLATSRGGNRIEQFSNFTYKSLDITNATEVLDVFASFKPTTVINTAAMTNVDACEDDKEGCDALNIAAVEHLISRCKQYNAHLVHLSTDFVFDGEDGPYKEEDVPNPLSYYGQSKYKSEQLIINSGLEKWSVVRTIIVYGIGDNMSRSNIVLWAKGALEKGQELNIVDDQFRAPTLAEDLAEGCILIADQGATGIYHISGSDQMHILELVQRVAKFFNLSTENLNPSKSSSLNQAAKRPPRTGFVLDKAINSLGYNPHTFEEGLAILASQLNMNV